MADDHLQKTVTSEVAEAISCQEDSVAADENPSTLESKSKQLEFSDDEETLIIRMYNLVGDRWSLIAGRIPGRNAEEIEKYWNSRQSINKTN